MNSTLFQSLAAGMSDYGAENSWSCGEGMLWLIFVIIPVWGITQAWFGRKLGLHK